MGKSKLQGSFAHMCVIFAEFSNEFNSQLQNAKFNIQYKIYFKIKLLENTIKMFHTYSVAILNTALRVYMHSESLHACMDCNKSL